MKKLSPKIESVLKDILLGIPVVIVDDYDRENEGDLMIAAQKANRDNLIFMMNYAKGLMCIPTTGNIIDSFGIPQMYSNNGDKFQTPFTVSVDASNGGSGMSVDDRLKTIEVFTCKNKSKLNMPGHMFPLRARNGLLKERQGHTEASVTLTLLADLDPIAIIIEIMGNEGEMLRGEALTKFAQIHNLNTVSVKEIYEAAYQD